LQKRREIAQLRCYLQEFPHITIPSAEVRAIPDCIGDFYKRKDVAWYNKCFYFENLQVLREFLSHCDDVDLIEKCTALLKKYNEQFVTDITDIVESENRLCSMPDISIKNFTRENSKSQNEKLELIIDSCISLLRYTTSDTLKSQIEYLITYIKAQNLTKSELEKIHNSLQNNSSISFETRMLLHGKMFTEFFELKQSESTPDKLQIIINNCVPLLNFSVSTKYQIQYCINYLRQYQLSTPELEKIYAALMKMDFSFETKSLLQKRFYETFNVRVFTNEPKFESKHKFDVDIMLGDISEQAKIKENKFFGLSLNNYLIDLCNNNNHLLAFEIVRQMNIP